MTRTSKNGLLKLSPLQIHDVTVGSSSHQVGIFGCTLLKGQPVSILLEHSEKISAQYNITLQLINADGIAGATHLLFATLHALMAFRRKTHRATTLGMEILRFAAAQRQITKALELLGITDNIKQIGGILADTSSDVLFKAYEEFLKLTGAKDSPDVLDITSSAKEQIIKEVFGISELELQTTTLSKTLTDHRLALQKLVYDRCALLATIK
jgi:KEOPS complex subunit Cgi121